MSPHDIRFEVEFFRDDDGVKPVAVFLRSLASNPVLALNTKAAISALQDGLLHKEPFTKALSDDLYEVRIEGKDDVRVLFFYTGAGRVIVVHAFQKKSQKTPRAELAIALQRKRKFEQRQRGEGTGEDRFRSRTR